jgi:RHS repeat-associated protein
VIALTNGSAAIEERYAYSAYGEPVFTNASGTVLSDSAKDNHYTYTGREWDEELRLYHFRARMYDAESGRFCGIDPIAYVDGMNLFAYLESSPLYRTDPTGQKKCEVTDFSINALGCGSYRVGAPPFDQNSPTVWGFKFFVKIEFAKPCCDCCSFRQHLLSKSYRVERKTAVGDWIEINDLPPLMQDYTDEGKEDCILMEDGTKKCFGYRDDNFPESKYSDNGCSFESVDTPNVYLPLLVDHLKGNGLVPGDFKITVSWRFLLNVIDTCNNGSVVESRVLDRRCERQFTAQ